MRPKRQPQKLPDNAKGLEIFLAVVDKRVLWMIEVKAGDDDFSPSLFRYHAKLPTATPLQIVYDLKRKKTKDSVRMLPAHEFLRDLQLLKRL